MRITQKAVAERLGVSISLVSRVLSGTANDIGVPQGTIDEVERTAKEMGYAPNLAARALKGKRTKVVGLVLYDFRDPFFLGFIAEVQERFHARGYTTVVIGLTEDEVAKKEFSSIHQHHLDAVILLGSNERYQVDQSDVRVPVFRIGYGSSNELSIRYIPDELESASSLLAHLSGLGLKRFTLLSTDMVAHKRRATVLEAKLWEGKMSGSIINLPNNSHDAAVNYINGLTNLENLPDVIICVTDEIAVGVLRSLNTRGIKVPERVRVTGFDDTTIAQRYYPSLTTFSQPIAAVIERILGRLESKSFEPGEYLMDCPLVVRESC